MIFEYEFNLSLYISVFWIFGYFLGLFCLYYLGNGGVLFIGWYLLLNF